MAEQHREPDARQLGDEALPQGDFPVGRSDFRVYFDAETHGRIVAHAAEDRSVEICGVLVGRWQQDANGPFAAVSASIRCDEAAKKSGEVTFTHDAWTTINREMDSRYLDLKIVGWYHSHPGFGVFLSERDTFIHEHFFSNPGQIALVVDPTQKTEGVFVWRDGKPVACGHYWIGARICTAAEEAAESSGAEGDRHIFRSDADRKMSQSPAGGSFWTTLAWALPLASMFLIGYLLADMKSAWERQRIVEGTVAHFGTWKCLRPGLRENLDTLADNVKVIEAVTDQLAKKHAKSAGDDAAAVQREWDKVVQALTYTRATLYAISDRYGLDPGEELAMKAELVDRLTGAPASNSKPAAEEKSAGKGKPATKEPPVTREKSAGKPAAAEEVAPCPPRTNRCGSATPT